MWFTRMVRAIKEETENGLTSNFASRSALLWLCSPLVALSVDATDRARPCGRCGWIAWVELFVNPFRLHEVERLQGRRVRLWFGSFHPVTVSRLRSPRHTDRNRFNLATALGAVSTSDEWTNYAKGVAFGFYVLLQIAPVPRWLRSPRAGESRQSQVAAAGNSQWEAQTGLKGVAFGFNYVLLRVLSRSTGGCALRGRPRRRRSGR